MTARRFVDTNILIYARDASEPRKQEIAQSVMRELWQTKSGYLSVQVLNEYFVNVTQKLKPGLSRTIAWGDVEALNAWNPVALDFKVLDHAYKIQSRYLLSWWDSLIVAAAAVSNCNELVSEDLAAGETYEGILVTNPFL